MVGCRIDPCAPDIRHSQCFCPSPSCNLAYFLEKWRRPAEGQKQNDIFGGQCCQHFHKLVHLTSKINRFVAGAAEAKRDKG